MLTSLTKLSQLPSQTLIYCGHEYSQKNAEFALTLEPENPTLLVRYQEVLALRKVSRPTLPVTLDNELKTNPFLRCHMPHMQKIAGHTDLLPAFTEIRARKDQY